VKIGFLPAIVMVFLIRKIGEGRAKQLLLTGDLINAEQALNFGMINGVMPAAELEGYVTELALRMCRENSGQSMQITKSLMVKVQDKKHKKALGYAAELNATARSNQDCVRGIEAFLNKEKIEW
jgi:methylglutaconyl-CoA hydratase